MDADGGRTPVGRVAAVARVVVMVLAVLGGVSAAVDEALADGSNRGDWATMTIALLLVGLAVVSRRQQRRG